MNAIMATPSFLVLLLTTLAVITSTTPSSAVTVTGSTIVGHQNQHSKAAATDFIRVSCRATRYPTLCFDSLSVYANQIDQSKRQIALAALTVSLSRARSASLFVSKLTTVKGIKHREFEAVKDCIENMGDSVDELSLSVRELRQAGGGGGRSSFEWHMSNVQTWVSAALTDQQTCVDGFGGGAMDGNVKDAIRAKVVEVAQVTSNALVMVNRFASGH